MKSLSTSSGAGLEIEEHRKMELIAEKYGCAAKFSGAGGGDCGIAISFDANIAHRIENEWKENDIVPLDVKIAESGVG